MIREPAFITFIRPGFYTSVQDLGRKNLARFGVPYSGAMDMFSFRRANFILQNQEEAACLEMTQIGPEMEFEAATQVVFTGALCKIFHNQKEVKLGKILDINPRDRILIHDFIKGQRCYMAIKGGIEAERIANSRSWYSGITKQNRIKKNDRLIYLSEQKFQEPSFSHIKIDTSWFETNDIQVYPGPEWHFLTEKQKQILQQHQYSLSDLQNRMGIQLNEKFDNSLEEILTAPVYPGTVQLTPSGKIIILMRDAQVTGGYPRIMQVSESSLNVLAQKKPGNKIKFCMQC